jgi:hypothetical protein
MTDQTDLIPQGLELEIDMLLHLTRMIYEKTDEVTRRIEWVHTSLFEFFGQGRKRATLSFQDKVRTLNYRVYDITGEFPFSPIGEIFPIETPSPTSSEPSSSSSNTSERAENAQGKTTTKRN